MSATASNIFDQDDLLGVLEQMPFSSPEYSREVVNKAARVLLAPDTSILDHFEVEQSFLVIGNWRSSHNFPLNTFQTTLRVKARQVSTHSLVAQRIKRLSSIALKLRRFPDMRLSQMQDIAGCRAILRTVADVDSLVKLYKRSDIKHKLASEDDYIRNPKPSGYRGIHIVYRYFSDKKPTFNNLKVEMQFRSLLQHAWATAVETVGTFIQQALKSSQGEQEWLRFFSLMGTAIAFREKTAPVPDTPTSPVELQRELRQLVRKLKVQDHLRVYAAALGDPEVVGARRDAHYYLLELDPIGKKIKVTGYKSDELDRASTDYLAIERRALSGPSIHDAVLVSVESIEALKRAYPNYFLDTHRFIMAVNLAIKKRR